MAGENVPRCHYCENDAEAECPSCGRLYCQDHGDDACLRCMSPEAATPNAVVFRGSLLALVVASLVVLFLLVRPPESKSETNLARDLPTSTAAVSATATPTKPGATTTPTPRPGTQVASSVTAAPGTAVATQPATSPTPAGKVYTMKAGDTLSDIAASYGVTVDAILALNSGLNPNTIAIGTEIKIP